MKQSAFILLICVIVAIILMPLFRVNPEDTAMRQLCEQRDNVADAMLKSVLNRAIRLRASRIDSKDMSSDVQRCIEAAK